jgi:PIN domain nuclease of toxin-antitoxin system
VTLLLDSHVVLWWFLEDRLTDAHRDEIALTPRVAVSVASVWELSIKAASGRLDLPEDPLAALVDEGFDVLVITGEDATAAAGLPMLHRDPFDRMLVAQAARRGLVLMTADRRLVDYPVPVRLIR